MIDCDIDDVLTPTSLGILICDFKKCDLDHLFDLIYYCDTCLLLFIVT